MKREVVSVLDIGSSKAVCVIAESDGHGGIRALGAGQAECKGVRRGVVTDLEEAARAIDGACRRAQQEAGCDVETVVAGIGGAGVETHEARGYVPIYPRTRPISRDDVLQVVNHSRQLVLPPDREQILALPREFRIDGQSGIQKPVGMVGGRLEVLTFLATAETAQIQNLERALSMTGRRAEMVVPQALASGLGVLTPEELELGSVAVDIGSAGTQVAVFDGGSVVHAAYVPIGAGHVTSDLGKLLKTSPEEAEALKLKGAALASESQNGTTVEVMQIGQTAPRPLDKRVLCEIIESRMRELATMVRQQVEKSGRFATLPAGIVLTGGGSLLPDTDKLFEKVFGHMKVRLGAPRVGGPAGRTVSAPEYAAAAGLALFALDSEDDELSAIGANGKWTERVRTLWSMLSGKA
jgi:cell division protein FtsA